MQFTEALNNTQTNISYTENGMLGYRSTNNPYLDFLYAIPSFRGKAAEELTKYAFEFLESCIHQGGDFKKYLLKFIMYIRDPRKGLGERTLGRELLATLLEGFDFDNKEDVFIWILNRLYDYGRWDDYVYLIQRLYLTAFDGRRDEEGNTHVKRMALCLKKDLEKDLDNMEAGAPVTLLAKWLPSTNASSKHTRNVARSLCSWFGWSEKRYRRTLSQLRKYLNVVERKMSLREWSEIDYEKVPSLANLRYKDAFLRHDEERRLAYLRELATGEVKINSSVNFPHDVVHRYYRGNYTVRAYDNTLEQLWKNLKEIPGLNDTLVIRDDSGSMMGHVGKTQVTALAVASALGIYCAERCSKAYQNKIISFSHTPKYLDFSEYTTLHDKLSFLDKHCEVANTDIRKVFQLVLKTALDNNLKQEDLPKQLLIISDMEFDEGVDYTGNPFEEAQKEFGKHGYTIPKLVFWNVCSRTNTVPLTMNGQGVYLLSGFSPNVLNLLGGSVENPFEALIEELGRKFKEVPEIN